MGDIRTIDSSLNEQNSIMLFVESMFKNFTDEQLMQFMHVFNEKMKERTKGEEA